MQKLAKNLTRLLARVGPDLAGATERDLKFLARRGFKGFTPKQVVALRSKGFLPTIKQEFAGFNKGTTNMLRGAEVVYSDNPAHGFNVVYESPTRHVVHIPEIRPDETVASQEFRSAMGRHEAREFARLKALIKSHAYDPNFNKRRMEQIGTSHLPGVIHDERIFRSQLSNRLGLGVAWDKLPVDLAGKTVRGARDAYIGSKPARYEHDLVRRWAKLRRAQVDRLDRELGSLMSRSDISEGLSGDIKSIMPEIVETARKEGLRPDLVSFDDVKNYVLQVARSPDALGFRNKVYSLPTTARRRVFDVSDSYKKRVYRLLADKLHMDAEAVEDILLGYGVPQDREIEKVMQLSRYTAPNPALAASAAGKRERPGLAFLRRLLRIPHKRK